MARIYKILPHVDDDFHPALGFVMFIMAIIMLTSLFSYRSLIQALVMIYTSYLALTFKIHIRRYFTQKMNNTLTPVMAPYNKRSVIEESDNDGYEEDSDHEKDELDVKCDSPENSLNKSDSEELDDSHNPWSTNIRKRNSNPFSHDTI